MADINNPILTAFVREVARPAAEAVSAVEANADFVLDRYLSSINELITDADPADVIIEGRGPDGVSELTVGELQELMAGVNRIRTANSVVQRRHILRGRVRIMRAE